MNSQHKLGQRIAIISMSVSAALAISKIVIGLVGGSTSVVADGIESAGDVVASGFVFLGLSIAARPADDNHPYGHGRYETITGLLVGVILLGVGFGICYRSLQNVGGVHAPPELYTIWPVIVSIIAKTVLSAVKFRFGRRLRSSAIVADAWNDFVDILSAFVAILAVLLTLFDPARFLAADHYGGFAVGLIVIGTGLRVAKDTTDRLTDVLAEPEMLQQIRQAALSVPGGLHIEKCFARNTGLQYHVDLHLEVDPDLTVSQSHQIATQVRFAVREALPWVADVLVHVEPHDLNGR